MAVDLGIEGFDELEEIGRGGFGVVYKARQTDLGRVVAIKVLGGVLDDRARARFEREGRAMGALSDEAAIVTVHSTGFTADDRPFIVMEYLPGGTLNDRLADGPSPMGWREAFEIGAKLADALGFAHQAGILHRDIKPANVLLSRRGEPKLGDFGIARLKGAAETASGVVTTTVAHAAPEVLAGKRPSEASDVYSLGSTIYTLIAGSPAFVHDSDESMLPVYARIATEAVPDLRPRNIPDAACRLLEHAMRKDPEARVGSAAEFAQRLRDVLNLGEARRGAPGPGRLGGPG